MCIRDRLIPLKMSKLSLKCSWRACLIKILKFRKKCIPEVRLQMMSSNLVNHTDNLAHALVMIFFLKHNSLLRCQHLLFWNPVGFKHKFKVILNKLGQVHSINVLQFCLCLFLLLLLPASGGHLFWSVQSSQLFLGLPGGRLFLDL